MIKVGKVGSSLSRQLIPLVMGRFHVQIFCVFMRFSGIVTPVNDLRHRCDLSLMNDD